MIQEVDNDMKCDGTGSRQLRRDRVPAADREGSEHRHRPVRLVQSLGRGRPGALALPGPVIQHYHAQLEATCRRFPTCRYDSGALHRMVITAEDLAPGGLHLSIAGHRKQAALEWRVLGLDS